MNTSANDIKSAIARSTSHNEIVKVEDGRHQEDVWGTKEDGSGFWLLLDQMWGRLPVSCKLHEKRWQGEKTEAKK